MGKAPKCKFTWMQSLWVLAGLILLGGALLSLFDGHEDLTSIAVPLGVMMLLTGVINIFIYRKKASLYSRLALAFGGRNEYRFIVCFFAF